MRKAILLMLILTFFLAGCGQVQQQSQEPVNIVKQEWTKIENQAKGTEVRIFMWGGDENINRYMDDWVAPRLKEQYNISLVRTPMNAPDFLQKLMAEKKVGLQAGTMDIIWVNGENFKNAKDNGLLSVPFVQTLPNYQAYVDSQSDNVLYDFGTPVGGLEAPWGKVQFVYLYDSAKAPVPPRNFKELGQWIKENPGKFTYPDPADFTGNAFLRHLLYNNIGVKPLLAKGFDKSYVENNTQQMWDYLKDLKPYLWRKGETYPQSLSLLDQLFSQGEVWINMGYNEARAEALIKEGTFPKTTKSFVMEAGSIGNTHFLAIPYNSPNLSGAMVAINFLLSPDAQLAKLEPANWGDNTVLDRAKLPTKYKEKLDKLNRGASVLPAAELQKAMQPEVSPEYVAWIKEKWVSEVARPSN